MIWKTFKGLITTICWSFASLILIAEPFEFATFAFACFLFFLGTALWIDFTKPLSHQSLSANQRKVAKLAIWGLVIFFAVMFASSIFSGDVHLNTRGFVQLISSLLKIM